MPFVQFYFELEVYKLSRELAKEVYIVSMKFPIEERFSLTDQIRRASRSIGGQIAEAWGKRRYINHFISKLTDGDAEQYETRHWIELAHACELVSSEELQSIVMKCDQINNKLNAMMSKADKFSFKP
ncbi:four helix bundle protein [Algoriphagus alkaliphilus]|uniref:Four helix bundle protein n=1 Tax=Algoriphagus alkaliphilus TaxID=279824 RepID=A0A1G5ZHJ7_9BACT|nr:four helix bundle protein [Algoriphagus alkaliphilus]SDA94067.1 four helix bundle protein [Algoriphagus alkaliphilus]